MLHIVAQIVEPELVVGRIGNVRFVSRAALRFGQVGHDHPHGQPQEGVDLPHPFRVATGQVIIDRNDVDAFALNRIEVGWQRRHQGFAFAGAHLGDFTAVHHDPTDHLHVEVPHAQHALASFADRRESFGQQIVKRLAVFQHPPEFERLRGQFRVAQRFQLRLKRIDLADNLIERFDVTIVG